MMRQFTFIAAICIALTTCLSACSDSKTEATLRAKSVTIDGKANKDVVIVDGNYILADEGDNGGTSSHHITAMVTFSLVSPLTDYTAAPQIEVLADNEVLATLSLGTDASDVSTTKTFGDYCHGVLKRTFDAPFYYNTDDAEEAARIISKAKTFRVVNMFK